ncbi:hypothetical protein HY522_08125 [bacterium]|nr:hypothetical protein [bacterium]
MGIAACVVILALSACATPVKLAGKAAWMAVKLGTGLVWETARGIGRIGTKETVHAIDLTADAALAVLAQKESTILVEAFWSNLQGGAWRSAYGLFSDSLKRQMSRHDFETYVRSWISGVSGYRLLDLTVHQFHVEVPSRLMIKSKDSEEVLDVKVYVSKLKQGWKITGWEAPPAAR